MGYRTSCMHLTELCPICKGNAKVRSTGNMLKPCSMCDATGYIKHKPANDKVQLDDMDLVRKPKVTHKKRGRKPKEIAPEPVLQVFNTDQNVMVNTNKTNKSGLTQ